MDDLQTILFIFLIVFLLLVRVDQMKDNFKIDTLERRIKELEDFIFEKDDHD